MLDEKVIVKFKKLHPDAVIPSYAHGSDNDAGMDLVALEDAMFTSGRFEPPGAATMVRTGIAIELPPGHEGQIRPRSGLACKHLVTVANSPGTIDPGYRGEILVGLVNHGRNSWFVHKGDRIAQLVIAPYARCTVVESETLSDTERGEGGFGSTGK